MSRRFWAENSKGMDGLLWGLLRCCWRLSVSWARWWWWKSRTYHGDGLAVEAGSRVEGPELFGEGQLAGSP